MSRGLHFLIVGLFAGCTDPVVEMTLRLPDVTDDTSCVTAIEVRAIGQRYPLDKTDYTRTCLELPHPARTYGELRDMIRDRVTLEIPDGGLGGVAVRGWAGVSACDRTDNTKDGYRDDFTSNLVFYAKDTYVGQDELELRVVPNLKCPMTSLKVRVVDMMSLVKAGSSAGCTSAMTYADGKGWSGVGTITPRLFGRGVDYFGNVDWRAGTNNVAQFDGMIQLVTPGQASCLALAGVNETGANTACVVGGQSVCAASGEIESAAIRYGVWNQVDRTVQGSFPSIVWGSVWSNASPKTPLSGATVTVDEKHAKVVYVDPPGTDGVVHARADQRGTGPSGLFVLYSDAVVSAKVDAAGKTRTLLLGAPDYTMGGAMIVVP